MKTPREELLNRLMIEENALENGYYFINMTGFEEAEISERTLNEMLRRIEEYAEYQTHVYKQDHPRLKAKGKEIWGVCIAYQGKGVVGDIAGSEKEAYEKLDYWLNYLKDERSKKNEKV